MVLSQNRGSRFSLSDDDGKAFNPLRIAATSAAIALHAIALMVLIAPVAMPPAIEEQDVVRPVIFWPEQKQPIPDPPPPIEVPVVQPQTPTPVATQTTVAVADVPIVSDEGTEAYVPPVDAGPATPANIEPVSYAAVRLEYVDAPAPAYPRDALRAGRQGTVMLQVTVGTDGRPTDVQIVQSSGHRDLDAAARTQVLKRWRFRAAMKDGQAIQAIGMVPINFTLNR